MTNPTNERQPKENQDTEQTDLDIDWEEALAEQKAGEQARAHQENDDDDVTWEKAMAEQQAGEVKPPSGELKETQAKGLSGLDDEWAAALAEQEKTHRPDDATVEQSKATSNQTTVFKPLDQQSNVPQSEIDMIMDIPVQLSVELGRTRLTIKNILQLGQGSVVELDGLAGEPMDIFVNGYLIAQGEVVVVDDKYGIRITDIITPSDRIHRLNTRR